MRSSIIHLILREVALISVSQQQRTLTQNYHTARTAPARSLHLRGDHHHHIHTASFLQSRCMHLRVLPKRSRKKDYITRLLLIPHVSHHRRDTLHEIKAQPPTKHHQPSFSVSHAPLSEVRLSLTGTYTGHSFPSIARKV